ncbi:MAG: hypothetical protein R6V01_02115 [Thermoplasmatota archaeon]
MVPKGHIGFRPKAEVKLERTYTGSSKSFMERWANPSSGWTLRDGSPKGTFREAFSIYRFFLRSGNPKVPAGEEGDISTDHFPVPFLLRGEGQGKEFPCGKIIRACSALLRRGGQREGPSIFGVLSLATGPGTHRVRKGLDPVLFPLTRIPKERTKGKGTLGC